MERGAERYCFLMERYLGLDSAAGAIEPYVREQGHAWCDVTYVKPGGWVERLPAPDRLRGTLRAYLQTTDALRAGPFRALLFCTHNTAVFHPRTLVNTPTLIWTDATPAQLDLHAELYTHPPTRSRLYGKFKFAAVQHALRSAALCVGWSEWARRSYVSDYQVPEHKTTIVAPGIDLDQWPITQRTPAAVPRVLFVGGHFKRKGGQLLLDIYRKHFTGRCELDLVTRDDVPESPGVQVHRGLSPESARMRELFRTASVFVLPTLSDFYSIATLEAMAAGLPVILSNVGGTADIVVEASTGYLIQPGDGTALRSALEILLNDPSRCLEMGAQGRRRVEQHFDAKKSAGRLLELMYGIARPRLN